MIFKIWGAGEREDTYIWLQLDYHITGAVSRPWTIKRSGCVTILAMIAGWRVAVMEMLHKSMEVIQHTNGDNVAHLSIGIT